MVPAAPLIQILNCKSGHTLTDKLQRHNDAMEHKVDLMGENQRHTSIIFWLGDNAFKASLAAGTFQDQQRLWRRIDEDRRFNVAMGHTQAAFNATSSTVADATAVALVVGKVSTGVAHDFYEGSSDMGESVSSTPGMIGSIFLEGSAGKDEKLIGCCYLFTDEESMDAYLASERAHEATWQEVTVEKYHVPSPPAAAGA